MSKKDNLIVQLFWLVLLLVMLSLGFLVQSIYLVYAIYVFLIVFILSSILNRLWLRVIDCNRIVKPVVINEGQEVEVTVFVHNKFWLPIPWLYVEDITPSGCEIIGSNAQLFILKPDEMMPISYKLRCPRRGYHRIGPLVMETGDFFGLQRRFRTDENQEYITVLPSVVYIKSFQVSTRRPHGPVRVSHKIYEDPTRIYGIREYTPGDPLKSIHWKVSAKANKLQVKTYEPATVIGATLVLDMFEDNYLPQSREERMELAITTTASIAYLLHLSGEPVGFVTNGMDASDTAEYKRKSEVSMARDDLVTKIIQEQQPEHLSPLIVPTRRSPVQLQKILENLARVIPGKKVDIPYLLQMTAPYFPRDNALILIVPQVSDDLASVVENLRANGFIITVFLIKDDDAYKESVVKVGKFGIHIFHIQHEQDLFYFAPQKIGV
ncbi:MAG TPA: DUF58 domain-containing protein [Candidatus Hydrogenedens sp.]|nr:DUF58 domain-containing protein [Candidatus Hydrogenedens sp.]